MSVLVLTLLGGCRHPGGSARPGPSPGVGGAPDRVREAGGVTFGPLEPAAGSAVAAVAPTGSWSGRSFAMGFHPLLTAGERIGGVVFGQQTAMDGSPIPWTEGAATAGYPSRVCNVGDFGSLLQNEHGLFHVGHFECTVGDLAITPVRQAPDGALSVGTPRMVDLAPVGGGHTFCAGDRTPWATHLAAEEYDGDARRALPDGSLPGSADNRAPRYPWEWSGHDLHRAYRPDAHPYHYGWIPEVTVLAADGRASVVKHYAMGRFSHELALVMPDRRTVYLTDDQHHGAFFLFVADLPERLDAGVLYAARFRPDEDGSANLDWVSLGHADDAVVLAALSREGGVQFGDLFDAGAPGPGGECPAGLRVVTTTWGTECLAAKDPLLASRFESRRMAGLLGATTELDKTEGLALDPGHGPSDAALYLAMSAVGQGMLDEQGAPAGPAEWDATPFVRASEHDHLRLPPNPCGQVVGLAFGASSDRDGRAIDSPWVARRMEPTWVGRPLADGRCAPDAVANPDNLAFAEELGLLFVAEDTSLHERDVLWALDRRAGGAPMRVAEVDLASEVSGLAWSGPLGGRGYLTMTVQWDMSDWPDHRSVMGYLGPFPLDAVAP